MPHSESGPWLSLVVDGGGSKTCCSVHRHDAGTLHVLGRGRASGSNPAALGIDAAVQAILSAANDAIAAARIQPSDLPVERAAFAVAGTLDDGLRSRLESRLSAVGLAHHCHVVPDVLPIVLSSSTTGVGAAVIAGTGSVAVARSESGRLTIAGGWGYLLGDEGSGFHLGRQAVRRVLTQLELGQATEPLTELVLDALDAQTVDEVKQAIYGDPQPRQRLAALAPLVVQQAAAADAVAQELLDQAARDLVEVLQRALSRSELRVDGSQDRLSVAAAGGLMGPESPLGKAFCRVLAGIIANAQVHFVDDPLVACQRLVSDELFGSPVHVAR